MVVRVGLAFGNQEAFTFAGLFVCKCGTVEERMAALEDVLYVEPEAMARWLQPELVVGLPHGSARRAGCERLEAFEAVSKAEILASNPRCSLGAGWPLAGRRSCLDASLQEEAIEPAGGGHHRAFVHILLPDGLQWLFDWSEQHQSS